jgi:hypothetical protein
MCATFLHFKEAAALAGRLAAYAAEDPWTESQARAWWETHLPAATP